jgi:rare lipoprotein A
MKKSITIYGVALFLMVPLFISCSLLETLESNIDKTDAVNMSCDRKGSQTLATASIHQVKGEAHVYKGNRQGKQAANCDVIDMNSFTAAHPTLPLPSHIKITNTQTNKSVVVKVNDRSSAQQDAILLVTPAVANLLGAKSSFPVIIDVIPTNTQSASKTKTLPIHPINKTGKTGASPKVGKRISANKVRYYIVVGTYASQEKALAKFTRLSSMGIDNATMETRRKQDMLLHMVRIGPFYQQDAIDKVKNQLQSNGLVKFTVVKN